MDVLEGRTQHESTSPQASIRHHRTVKNKCADKPFATAGRAVYCCLCGLAALWCSGDGGDRLGDGLEAVEKLFPYVQALF